MGAIILCRHGETAVNAAGAFLSRQDVELSERGRAQCERLRDALSAHAFARVLVSPMRRCLQTREIVAPHLPFDVVDALREVDFGAWEGKTLEWLERTDPVALAQRRGAPVHFRPPQGESFADVAQRLPAVLQKLEDEGNVLVIGHRGTLGVLERLLRRLPLESQEVQPLEPAEFRTLSP
ncbi:MAG TPA: histidine phosphatase family protein [Candidatus Cybelea sp.]|nr:histidine phosphatase family protein [Candidatus Cybelea sp.]